MEVTDNTRRDGRVTIGWLSESTGVPVRTIRFYCDAGILDTGRSVGGHRTFDPRESVERLNMVRRLRALGLGLPAISEVLDGARSLADAVAAERAAVDAELSALAWRRALLQAAETGTPAVQDMRLAMLATVANRAATRDAIITFWRRVLSGMAPEMLDGFIEMNVPELPADPDPERVLAYAELATVLADPTMTALMRQQVRCGTESRLGNTTALMAEVAEACEESGLLMAAGIAPRPGAELDRFVAAHATVRGESDTPMLRRRLFSGGVDTDRRVRRYWDVTGRLLDSPITSGDAHLWLYTALGQSISAAVNPVDA
ncbi:MerR family transcriptional regulator [Nocardia sp. NPDC051030]|uniref:MerR family transcriptional regulator n=1 Tax=Nocardia sp. NPDC051030 TaxID=3155162 RepID=UPI00343F7B56